MERVASGLTCRSQKGFGIQVAMAGGGFADTHRLVRLTYVQRRLVGSRVHRDATDAELAAGAYDPQCDFAAVCDQDPVHRLPKYGDILARLHDVVIVYEETVKDPALPRQHLVKALHDLDQADDISCNNLVAL
jgi:hypothetical protein